MNIKAPEAHELAKELAALDHVSITEAVTISLRERLERRRRETSAEERLARSHAIVEKFAEQMRKSPGPDPWQVIEDLYDERGLPR